MSSTPGQPLPYHPGVERLEPGEAESDASLERSVRGILARTWGNYGHAVRGVHAKSHGLLEGELQVLDGLPPALAQGVFARAATYPAAVRVSINPSDVMDDSISAPRGIAVKLIGVSGERLPGSEADVTQDFTFVNGPYFVVPSVRIFAGTFKTLALSAETGQVWKKAVSAVLRGVAAVLNAAGTDSGLVKGMGGQVLTHPLGETYYTQTAFRHGDYVAKLSLLPVSPELAALKDRRVSIAGQPNGLRAAVIDFFRSHGATWELRVQLRTNADTMPVEDASVAWPEAESPYLPVARLVVPPQPAWSEARARQVDDSLAFNPWHGLEAHRPLGAVNRARRRVYGLSAAFRGARNGCPMREPQAWAGLSADPAAVFGAPGREGRWAGASRRPRDGRPLQAGLLLLAVVAGVLAVRRSGRRELGRRGRLL